MDKRQENLGKLSEFAQQLRRQQFPQSTVSIKLATYFADAIESYLSGKSGSLEAAFGLLPGRGATGDPAKREAIARKINKLINDQKSWREIADAASSESWGVTDERTLRRYYAEFLTKIWGELIEREWDSEDGA